ncbi:NUDIX hydrolase [Falsibacillus pallidus]|uniref:NUDIX domain-containing protein n=1 Tax=Falsibacillus pallidus TaxID=493781 RepID=A0A370GQ42_9BACI|nr:NUDIX domain-containing protein [Falsibacillus pallidus]RDI45631.1 NUDIX domain-containing protein [Falsibacillus pallidus]
MTTQYVNWGKAIVKLTWISGFELPPRDLITSVHGFCFHEGKVLLVNLNHRGWDFPGGHIEGSETPEECFLREAFEEGYVSGRLDLLGCIEVNHQENPLWSKSSPYPMVGYQVFYRMNIDQIYPFEGTYESDGRIFINEEEVKDYYPEWHLLYEKILQQAVNAQ